MKRTNIKQMISENKLALGLMIHIPSPEIVEIAGMAGCHFVRLDMEHDLFDLESVANMVRAADAIGISVMARVPHVGCITSLLDFGVTGIMMPHVRSAEQAKEVVDLVKYYPIGRRGMIGCSRAQKYGLINMKDYIKQSSDENLLAIQIEDKEGIENMEEILSVKGIDLVNIGRADISQALGYPGETNHSEVIEIENRVLDIAKKNNVGYQLSAGNLEVATDYIDRGLRALTIGNDSVILLNSLKGIVGGMTDMFNRRVK